jgi:hypothetical protein
MKPYLLYEQNNENIGKKISNENELVQDLNLHIIFKAMAHDNDFLYRTVKSIVSLKPPNQLGQFDLKLI